MLFMSIYTWDTNMRDEIIKRRAENGPMTPDGVKILGEWTDLQGNRDIVLYEVDNNRDILISSLAWSDLGKWDTFPVMEAEDVMKQVTSG